MRRLLLTGALCLIVAGLFSFSPARAGEAPVVVELFTSQGCSSCIPAQAYMRELAKRDDVIALEFHVDYWDYIGWKDRFARPEFTDRQHQYRRTLKSRYVYTPQMVINGRVHNVGSDVEEAERQIGKFRDMADSGPKVTLRHRGDNVMVAIAEGHASTPVDVYFVTYDDEHTTEVTRGENAGVVLVNARVVREIHRIGRWDGASAQYTVSLAGKSGEAGCAVLLQLPDGPIQSAQSLAFVR
jgi:hypothetical protein